MPDGRRADRVSIRGDASVELGSQATDHDGGAVFQQWPPTEAIPRSKNKNTHSGTKFGSHHISNGYEFHFAALPQFGPSPQALTLSNEGIIENGANQIQPPLSNLRSLNLPD